MKYRAEIDGLRALAVLPVILFHAGFSMFSGGYVGVDVFFVISGYLITSIIHEEQITGRFSIIQFYERRARRILPALFAVMAISSIFAYRWMLPDELENFGQSVVATIFFSNNILLLLTAGYWDLASELKPLLHTWSLGVEEQFYILFPLLLMLAWRFFRERTLHILAALAVLSLCGAQWTTAHHPQASFYLLPTRAWELLVGSIAALYLKSRTTRHLEKHSGWLAFSGVAMIVLSVLLFNPKTPNPSVYTLIPIAGAALIVLFAQEGNLAHRLLASAPFVKIGLISYSAYLWHFPLFAFARIYSVNPPGHAISLALCLVTLILAYVTWRFVESPFRHKQKFGRQFIFTTATAISAVFVAGGAYLHKQHGLPSRISSRQSKEFAGAHIGYNEAAFKYRGSQFPKRDGIKVLVIGNSFARDFVNMLRETFPETKLNIVYRDDLSFCLDRIPRELQETLIDAADVVVFASGIAAHACIEGNISRVKANRRQIFYIGTKNFGYNMNWLARMSEEGRKNQRNPLLAETLAAEKKLADAVPKEHFISLLDAVVENNTIPITDENGLLLSPDRTHLTRQGAILFGKRAILPSPLGQFIQSR